MRARRMVDSTLRRVSPVRLDPRGVVSPVMGLRDGSTPEVPCSLGLKPPLRHHRRAGVGGRKRSVDDYESQPLEAGDRSDSRLSYRQLSSSVYL